MVKPDSLEESKQEPENPRKGFWGRKKPSLAKPTTKQAPKEKPAVETEMHNLAKDTVEKDTPSGLKKLEPIRTSHGKSPAETVASSEQAKADLEGKEGLKTTVKASLPLTKTQDVQPSPSQTPASLPGSPEESPEAKNLQAPAADKALQKGRAVFNSAGSQADSQDKASREKDMDIRIIEAQVPFPWSLTSTSLC